MLFNETQYSKLVTVGYTKNKTITLTAIKEEAIRKKNRFRKNFMPNVKYSQLENLKDELLMGEKGDVVIEMTQSERPVWMNEHEEITSLLNKIEKNFKEQKKLINDKKLNLFSNDNTCDHQISQNFDIGTQILDKARNRVNTFANFAKTLKTEQEQIVCLNAQKALLMKLKEITDNFNQQKKSYEQAKKPIQSSFANVESLDEDPEDETIQSQALIAHNRTEDINKLSQTFTDLASIFQQMHQLVMEQGTIIDRIDYNLESAQNYIHKGTDTLKKTHTQMKSRCADNVIKMLVSLIIIFSVLLVLKYARY